jgi:hypothetical protein
MLPLLLACEDDAPPAPTAAEPRGEAPTAELAGPVLKRLTATQYENAVHDLFGDDIVVPEDIEPDEAVDGLLAIGAGVNSISPSGVEGFEDAAYSIAEQAIAAGTAAPCSPTVDDDLLCAKEAIAEVGRRAWRRALTDDEVDRHLALFALAVGELDSFQDALAYPLAALLQSTNFLYRVELGEDDPAGGRRYTDAEMASRLSFFLWNTIPDEELLAAAEAGELVTDAGLAGQIDRLLGDDRAREGLRAFFTDMLTLYELDDLNKDPTTYTHMSADVGPSAREETLAGLEYLVFEEAGDYRDILTTRRAFVDRKLAAIYAIPAPVREGFGETTLEGDRMGLLGQVSFLALASHPANTSVTRRGMFVREVLLCQDMPSPPAGVDTSIPEATTEAPTMRERVAQHLEDPSCSGCHNLTDYIGLGLENFDGLGGWRDAENGTTIDASGTLDGIAFGGPAGLGRAVRDHEDLGPCLAATVFRYATGHVDADGEDALRDWHARGFAENGYDVRWLLADIAASPAFRKVGDVE